MRRPGAAQQHIAAGHGGRHRIGAGLDAVGQHFMRRAVQLRHALDLEAIGADAINPGAHRDEAFGDIGDLGLHRGILDHRRAAGERCRHHDGVRRPNRHFRQVHEIADEAAARRPGHDIALVDVDLGPQFLEAVEEEIDRPRADGAAARQRHAGIALARQQRPDDPKAGAHHRDEFVGRGGVGDLGGMEGHALAGALVVTAAPTVHGDVDAMVLEDALELLDIGKTRHVLEDERLAREDGSDHQRQRRVLGARNGDLTVEVIAADETNTIHSLPRFSGPSARRACARRGGFCPVAFPNPGSGPGKKPDPTYAGNASVIRVRRPNKRTTGRRLRPARRVLVLSDVLSCPFPEFLPFRRPRTVLAAAQILPEFCGQSVLALPAWSDFAIEVLSNSQVLQSGDGSGGRPAGAGLHRPQRRCQHADFRAGGVPRRMRFSPCVVQGPMASTAPADRASTRAGFPRLGCRSSVVEHPLGKGEVRSSILRGSTSPTH